MKLIGKYNFAKAQNPQTGEELKFKFRMTTVRQYVFVRQKKVLN
jgi:CRISPR/Cas system Type II protein with McrA/HNH and RuvC-like nuclease domain